MLNNESCSDDPMSFDKTTNTAEFLFRISDASFKMETDRYESLSALATRMLTSISILAVAMMSALVLTAKVLVSAGLGTLLIVCSCLAFFFLLVAFICAMCSQIRFKHVTLANPATISKTTEEYEEQFPTRLLAAQKYAESYKDVHETFRNRNTIMVRLLSASMLSVGVALIVVVVAVISLVSATAACGVI